MILDKFLITFISIFSPQDSKKQYDSALNVYKPQKTKKDPNAPKQPLSAYFLFSQVGFQIELV